jgi:hypothetical protein
MDHSFWIPILKSLQGLNPKENHNIYLCKSSMVTLWLKEIVEKIIWYNRPREFLLQKDYSNNDDCLHVVIKKSLIGLCMTFVHVDDFIIELYTWKILTIILWQRFGLNQIPIKFTTWVYPLRNTYLSVFMYP